VVSLRTASIANDAVHVVYRIYRLSASVFSTQLSAPQITPRNATTKQYPEVDVFSGDRLEVL
jgi:hypothetical protein